jgi:hypothetical protein
LLASGTLPASDYRAGTAPSLRIGAAREYDAPPIPRAAGIPALLPRAATKAVRIDARRLRPASGYSRSACGVVRALPALAPLPDYRHALIVFVR